MRKIILFPLYLALFSCDKHNDEFISTSAFNKVYGGSNGDFAHTLIKSADGGFVIGGWTSSDNGDFSGNHGDLDAWILKLDKSGEKEWLKMYGEFWNDLAFSIIPSSEGGYVMVGESNSDTTTVPYRFYDAWAVKLDKNGDTLWQKKLGGSGDDIANAVTATPAGSYVMAGSTISSDGDVGGHNGGDDVWIVKLNENGNIIWQKTYGGAQVESANAIVSTSDGGFIVAGHTTSNDGDVSGNHGSGLNQVDALIIKLDKDGNKQWLKCLGGSGQDYGASIATSLDGGYVMAGYTLSNDGDVTGNHGDYDVWVLKLSSNGDLLWQKALGGSGEDIASAITPVQDGYVIAARTASNDGNVTGNHGAEDAWIIKIDATGNLVWQKTYGGSKGDGGRSIITTSFGNYIMAGYTSSNDGDVSGSHGAEDAWVFTLTDQ